MSNLPWLSFPLGRLLMTHLLILALVFIPLVFQPHLPIASTLFLGRVGGVDTHGRFISL
jgi:hypothetical protein